MISHPHKCIFVHIPKAAGQSVESVFVELNNLTWENRSGLLLKPNHNIKLGPPRLAHLKASEYTQCGHVPENIFQTYFKFSFVRNPWARLVSEYNYRRQHGDAIYLQPFNEFVLNAFPTDDKDDYINAKDYYRHVMPQWKFLYSNSGECLVDFIGRFESLQTDFDKVCNKLGIGAMNLPHKNRTLSGLPYYKAKLLSLIKADKPTKHYSQYYNKEAREYVAQYYAKDIELFGYSFDSP